MTYFALRFLSFLLSIVPGFVHRGLVAVCGDITFFFLPRRRRIILANLDHAFPDRPREWQHRIGRQSCRQMIETSLLSLILPHLSVRRIRKILSVEAATANRLRALLGTPQPAVFVTPHLGGWELGACLTAVIGPVEREMSCIYRPLDNAQLNAWVVRARSRFGITMMSRKKGLADAMRVLRGGGVFFILFDQAGPATGQLSVLLNRLCLSTPLPGLMVEKFHASLNTYVLRRVSFWRYQIESEPVDGPRTADEITRHLDRWLGNLLRHDDAICGSWLWAHNRWKLRQQPENQLRLEHRRSALLAQETIPRTSRFFVRLPDELRAVLWTLPLLRTLRSSRPDASITAIATPKMAGLLARSELLAEVIPAPSANDALAFARSLHDRYPDYWISFDDSGATDGEAKAARCPERFGIQRSGTRRSRLNHLWHVPPNLDESLEHRARFLERYFRHFGLEGEIDWGPVPLGVALPASKTRRPVLLAAQLSDITKVDCWPSSGWEQLVARFNREPTHPDLRWHGPGPAPAGTIAVPEDVSWPERLRNLASCRLVVTDDLDLLHLAGALGVPAIGLFGVANILREGPVFSASAWVVQPPDCPETGGTPLQELEPDLVLARMLAALDAVADG